MTIGKNTITFTFVDLNFDVDGTASDFVKAKASVGVYDITNPESLQNVRNFFGIADRYASSDNLPKFLAATKIDLESKVDPEVVKTVESNCQTIQSFRTSAKTGEGIKEMFEAIANYIISKENPVPSKGNKTNNENQGGCCTLL